MPVYQSYVCTITCRRVDDLSIHSPLTHIFRPRVRLGGIEEMGVRRMSVQLLTSLQVAGRSGTHLSPWTIDQKDGEDVSIWGSEQVSSLPAGDVLRSPIL